MFFIDVVALHMKKIYTGQENDSHKSFQEEPDLGVTENVVVCLVQNIPKHKSLL